MIIAQLLLLFITQTVWMPDTMCFTPKSDGGRSVLEKTLNKKTQRACEVACGDRADCEAYSYRASNCTLLGAIVPSMACTAPTEILVKQDTGCPVRTDLVAEVNKPKDTCVTAFFASETKLDVEGICPLDANNYVVRGIDEFGIRVTLDNNKANVLKFDSVRNLWAFTYAPTDFVKYFVSVSCATNSGTCPCGAVKGLNPTPPGGTNAMIEVTPICSDQTHKLTIVNSKGGNQNFSPSIMQQMKFFFLPTPPSYWSLFGRSPVKKVRKCCWRSSESQTANLFKRVAMRFSRFARINPHIHQYQFTVLLVLVHILFFVLFGVFVSFDELYAMPTAANDNTYLNSKYPYYMGTHVMIFIGFAYLMSFLKRYGYSAISINMLLACVTIEWSVLCRGFFSKQFAEMGTITLNIDSLLHADFSCACILITMGVVLGKLSPTQYLIMALIEVPASTATEHLVMDAFQINDAGGSIIVHVFGAYFGLALSLAFSNKAQRDHEHDCSIYHTDLFAMLGTLFIFVNWPSLNAATAVTAEEHHRAIINTHLSLVGCTVATFFVCPIFEPKKKFNMVQIANSTIAGGVAIGSCCNVVLDPILSLALGSIAGVISVLGYIYLTPFLSSKLRIHDTCGIHNFHGMSGILAGIFSSIMAVAYPKDRFGPSLPSIYPAMASGEQTEQGQALMQLAGLGTVFGISIAIGGVTGIFLRLPIINQVRDEEYFADGDYFHTPDDYEFTTKISGMVRHHHFEKKENEANGSTMHQRMVKDDEDCSV